MKSGIDTEISNPCNKGNQTLISKSIIHVYLSTCSFQLLKRQSGAKNKLPLNASKSRMMIFGTRNQQQLCRDVMVYHNGQRLEQCETFKYLGIVLDSRLNFKAHIDFIKSKTVGKIKLLGRIRNILDYQTATMLHKTLILPIYDYCDFIYFPSGNSAESLQKLQNCALRSILWADLRTSTDILHAQVQVPRLTE